MSLIHHSNQSELVYLKDLSGQDLSTSMIYIHKCVKYSKFIFFLMAPICYIKTIH